MGKKSDATQTDLRVDARREVTLDELTTVVGGVRECTIVHTPQRCILVCRDRPGLRRRS